jgi:ribosome maturation factor RimP
MANPFDVREKAWAVRAGDRAAHAFRFAGAQMTTADRLRELIEPIAAERGAVVFDLEFGAGKLEVTVDRSGGIDMEAIAAITRAISRQLDETDPIPGHYTLEVSSPGLERALRTPEHFAWAVGQKVSIKTVPDLEGDRRQQGTIASADDHAVTIATGDGTRTISYDDIEKARTVFEWGGQPKPGRNPRGAGAKNQTKTKRAKAS